MNKIEEIRNMFNLIDFDRGYLLLPIAAAHCCCSLLLPYCPGICLFQGSHDDALSPC